MTTAYERADLTTVVPGHDARLSTTGEQEGGGDVMTTTSSWRVTPQADGATRRRVSGGPGVDMASVHRLQAVLDDADPHRETRRVRLDDLTYMDTQGLRLLARRGPGTVIVARPGSVARQVLDLSRLSDVLQVVDEVPPPPP